MTALMFLQAMAFLSLLDRTIEDWRMSKGALWRRWGCQFLDHLRLHLSSRYQVVGTASRSWALPTPRRIIIPFCAIVFFSTIPKWRRCQELENIQGLWGWDHSRFGWAKQSQTSTRRLFRASRQTARFACVFWESDIRHSCQCWTCALMSRILPRVADMERICLMLSWSWSRNYSSYDCVSSVVTEFIEFRVQSAFLPNGDCHRRVSFYFILLESLMFRPV